MSGMIAALATEAAAVSVAMHPHIAIATTASLITVAKAVRSQRSVQSGRQFQVFQQELELSLKISALAT